MNLCQIQEQMWKSQLCWLLLWKPSLHPITNIMVRVLWTNIIDMFPFLLSNNSEIPTLETSQTTPSKSKQKYAWPENGMIHYDFYSIFDAILFEFLCWINLNFALSFIQFKWDEKSYLWTKFWKMIRNMNKFTSSI